MQSTLHVVYVTSLLCAVVRAMGDRSAAASFLGDVVLPAASISSAHLARSL